MQKVRIRAVVIGDDGSGKTSLIVSYLEKPRESIEPTTYPKLYTGVKKFSNITIEWIIWEIPSATPSHIRRAYYEDADGAIIVCKATDSVHLYKLYVWILDFIKNCGNPAGKPVVIVANFVDRATTSEGRALLHTYRSYSLELKKYWRNLVEYCETSARFGWNVNVPFETLARLVLALRRV